MNKSERKQIGWKICLKALKLEVKDLVEQTWGIDQVGH